MKKLKWLVLCLIPFCLFSFPKENQAQSETRTVQFTLHKLLFENGKLPETQLNTGQEQTFLQNYRGLNDVTFAAYDVTDAFYQLRRDGMSVEDAQQKIAAQGASTGNQIAEQVTQTVGNEDGIANFQLPIKDNQGRDSVYLFEEVKAPEIVKEKAANLVVALPINDADNQELATIHLYPKNEENTYPAPPFEKKIEEGKRDFAIGDKINYSLNTTIPVNLLDYSRFKISDQGDAALTLQPETIRLSINGQKMTEGYRLHTESNGFTVDFDLTFLQKYVGKALKLTYQMCLNDKAIPDEAINNEGKLDVGSSSYIDKAVVYTGGKHFIKVANENQIGLAGATFIVKNSEGNYLSRKSGHTTWTTKREEATTVASDKDGKFSIIGFAYGNYQLEEVQSPVGYILNKSPIPFEVTKYSYQQSGKETAPLKVINKKEKGKGFLPKTNEQRRTLWFVVGLGMILFVVSMLIKRKIGVKK